MSGIVTFLQTHVARPKHTPTDPAAVSHTESKDESDTDAGHESVVDSYIDRLESIARSVTWEASLPDLVLLIEELLASHKAEAASTRNGCLNVVPLERAGYAGRKHLFVLGLDEGVFPGGSPEDPILLDVERSAVSEELGLQQNRSSSRI